MNYLGAFKTTIAAAAFALIGASANGTTVAQASSSGSFQFLEFGSDDALQVNGAFDASFDPTFDPNQVNTFLFELDFVASGLPPIDEDLLVPGVTGNDIFFFALFVLNEIELALPGVIDSIIDEVLDSDGLQRELGSTGFFLSADVSNFSSTGNSIQGDFAALFSGVNLNGEQATGTGFGGDYSGSAKLSIVPLPATLPLMAFVAAGLLVAARRRKS